MFGINQLVILIQRLINISRVKPRFSADTPWSYIGSAFFAPTRRFLSWGFKGTNTSRDRATGNQAIGHGISAELLQHQGLPHLGPPLAMPERCLLEEVVSWREQISGRRVYVVSIHTLPFQETLSMYFAVPLFLSKT